MLLGCQIGETRLVLTYLAHLELESAIIIIIIILIMLLVALFSTLAPCLLCCHACWSVQTAGMSGKCLHGKKKRLYIPHHLA